MQIVWSLLLAVHLAIAGVGLWMLPGGFPSSSTAYWVNQVAPWVMLVWAAAALILRMVRSTAELAPFLFLGIPAFWAGFGASARVAYPVSSGAMWGLLFTGGLVLFVVWLREFGAQLPRRWLAPIFFVPALWAGWRAPLTQQAPLPSTQPRATALPIEPTSGSDKQLIKLGKNAQLRPSEGRLVMRHGDVILTVSPLLTIENRSPDRSLVSLAPPEDTKLPTRHLERLTRDGGLSMMRYRDEAATLAVSNREAATIDLDAHTQLLRDVYTHQNTYAELTLRGHHQLSIRFSPLPNLKVDVPAFTEPARFAYLDAAGVFHVVQARELTKGPFVELGAAKLGRDAPLTIQLYDGETLIFTVRFEDWASQASTALSPTAGWSVPVNAIQLVRSAAAADAPALIPLTLAATTIGRGSQTVGHAAGVYRNRMHIE